MEEKHLKRSLILGLDLSLNHFGLVVLDQNGFVLGSWFLTDIKKYLSCAPVSFFENYLDLNKDLLDKDVFEERRIDFICDLMVGLWEIDIVGNFSNVYVSIEGYANSSLSNSVHQMAELTGILKYNIFYKQGAKLRVHDPLSVKLFATGKGNCIKKDMVEAAKNCGYVVPDCLFTIKKTKKKNKIDDLDGPGTDLVDAYFLAKMLLRELEVRDGLVQLDQLPENERSIFLRVTKTYPVNLMARDFICKD